MASLPSVSIHGVDLAQPGQPDNLAPPPADWKKWEDIYNWYQDQMVGVLNELRAIVLDLAKYVADVIAKDQSKEDRPDPGKIVCATAEAELALARHAPEIARRLATLRHLTSLDSALAMRYAGRVEEIRLEWNRVLQSWSPWRAWPLSGHPLSEEQRKRADEMLTAMRGVGTDLGEMANEAAEITVPFRLDEVLKNTQIGKAVEFHKIFRTDLPDPEKRKTVLTELAENPPWALPGVPDLEKGVIIKISLDKWRRARSWLAPLALAEMPVVPLLLVGLSFVPGAVDTTATAAAGAYAMVLVGAVAHLLLQALKESRSSTGSRFKSTSDIGLWIHMNEIPLIFGVISLWVAFAAIATVLKSLDLLTAFVAGYSVDTFVDLFLQRFETKVAAITGANAPARG